MTPGIFSRIIAATFLFNIPSGQVMAHGDLHEQIAKLTSQVGQETNNFELYLQRAELYRLHGEWENALADFDRVLRLNSVLEVAELGRGKVLLATDRPQAALESVGKFLKRHPDHAEARLVYARSLERLDRHMEAAANFTKAIESTPEPMPDYYLECMRALVSAGKIEEAVQSLDEGMKRLGMVVSLQLPAVELEVQGRNFNAALTRLRTVADRSPRKETWAARFGEIYETAGRLDEARKAYAGGLAAMETLPPARRNTRMMKELEERLRNGLKRIETMAKQQKLASAQK